MAFESLLVHAYSRLHADLAGPVYHEEAFRHFLALERRRAERSNRSILLVLVNLKKGPDVDGAISPALTSALVSSLAACVREVDFTGWFREGRVAGAVLTHVTNPPADVLRSLLERVRHELWGRLPSQVRPQLKVRVVRLPRNINR